MHYRATLTPLLLVALLILPTSLMGQGKSPASGLNSEDERILYSLGVQMMLQLAPFQLSVRELKVVQKGMDAAKSGRYVIDPAEYQSRIEELAERRVKARAKSEAKKGAAFLKEEQKKKGAFTAPSGLVITVKSEGKGPKPKMNSVVKVHYHGTLIDGTVFDSSRNRGEAAVFPLNRVIPCWMDAFTQLKVGSKARLVCPPEIAYGNAGAAPAIPPGATLIFEVELLEIVKLDEPLPGAAPPKK